MNLFSSRRNKGIASEKSPIRSASTDSSVRFPPIGVGEIVLAEDWNRPFGPRFTTGFWRWFFSWNCAATAATVLWLLLTGCKTAAGRAASAERIPVLITTDCGADMDDQWVIAHVALSPRFDLRGIVTTHAPTLKSPGAETAAQIARDVLKHVHFEKPVPVLAGSSEPLHAITQPLSNAGVEFILRESRRYRAIRNPHFTPGSNQKRTRDRLQILVLGAATDVASALLIKPGLAERADIVAMAFDRWPEGGDSWNVKNDVRAWQILLRSGIRMTVGDAKVTRRDLALTPERAAALLKDTGTAGHYLVDQLKDWLRRNGSFSEKVTGEKNTWPVWDEVVVADLLDMTQAELRPRPGLRDDLSFSHHGKEGDRRTIRWITTIDSEALWQDLQSSLKNHNHRDASITYGVGGSACASSMP